jgi:hypothetical protein
MSFELFNTLTAYGDQFRLQTEVDSTFILDELEKYNNDWTPYNPRKKNNRWGLSLTNLDGKLGAGPDLDSLREYNREHNTTIVEKDFIVPTPVYDVFKDVCDPMKQWIVRSHILQLRPGGYFPTHIDNYTTDIESFRLLIPLESMNPRHSWFMMEDTILTWEYGFLYFINTCKQHTLFNAGRNNMTMVVFNVLLDKESVEYILSLKNMC